MLIHVLFLSMLYAWMYSRMHVCMWNISRYHKAHRCVPYIAAVVYVWMYLTCTYVKQEHVTLECSVLCHPSQPLDYREEPLHEASNHEEPRHKSSNHEEPRHESSNREEPRHESSNHEEPRHESSNFRLGSHTHSHADTYIHTDRHTYKHVHHNEDLVHIHVCTHTCTRMYTYVFAWLDHTPGLGTRQRDHRSWDTACPSIRMYVRKMYVCSRGIDVCVYVCMYVRGV